MGKRWLAGVVACVVMVGTASAESLPRPMRGEVTPPEKGTAQEILTDAAIIALIIAASIASYKAMGKPCACPEDRMSNGRACGGNSAYVRGGGYKPLCRPTDITAAMIGAYRVNKAIPGLR